MSIFTEVSIDRRRAGKIAWAMICLCSLLVIAMSVFGDWPTQYLVLYILNLLLITSLTFHPRVSPNFQSVMMALITFLNVFMTTLAEGELYPALLVFLGTTIVLVVYRSEKILAFYGVLIAGAVIYHVFIAKTVALETAMDKTQLLMRVATLAYALLFFIFFVKKMNQNLALLEELHRNLADQLEEKTREASAMKDASQQDALTGLWNRVYTQDAVDNLLSQGDRGALLMIDIDNFKAVNDTYGHGPGDDMLRALAEMLRSVNGEGDVLCRIGGDEFTAYLKNFGSKSAIRTRVKDLITGMEGEIVRMGFTVNTSISVGIAIAPDDGTDFVSLYSAADKALYHVKNNGKNAYHFFSDKLTDGE